MMDFSFLGAFGAGLLTFFSPCVLPLAPILVASLITIQDANRFDRLKATLWFSLGFSTVFVLMGLSIPALTGVLDGAKPVLLALSGAALGLFGLRMMGVFGESKLASVLTRSFHLPQITKKLPKGMHAIAFGALFGLSWTPCVGPVLGGVLTYAASKELSAVKGALLLLSFAVGISLPLLFVAIASDRVLPVLNRMKKFLPKMEYAVGLALFAFGIYIFSQARLQDFQKVNLGDEPMIVTAQNNQLLDLSQAPPSEGRMLFFYSDNCPICHAMEQYLPHFQDSCTSDNFKVVKINIDLPQNAAASSRFNVKAVPTVSFLNDQGSELIHLVGYQTEGRLREGAKATTQVACRDQLTGGNSTDIEKLQEGKTCSVGQSC